VIGIAIGDVFASGQSGDDFVHFVDVRQIEWRTNCLLILGLATSVKS
jgi:hypothetical protein